MTTNTHTKQKLRYSTFQSYLTRRVSPLYPTQEDLRKAMGLTTASRVSRWYTGEGVPNEAATVRLARLIGDDPLELLRLCGHTELADALEGVNLPPPPALAMFLHMVEDLRTKLATM